MRHSVPHIKFTDNVPDCPACDAPLSFTQVADIDRDGKVYLLFRCPACGRGEMKFWRPEWQEFTDLIVADEL
jgi:hypothetical protein